MPSVFRVRKLNALQRLEAYDLIHKGYRHKDLAKKYGVSRARITQIANATAKQLQIWMQQAELPPLLEEE